MNDITTAKHYLNKDNITFVAVKGETISTSTEHGIAPLIDMYENSRSGLSGAYVADRVIGKAASFILAAVNIRELYAQLISEPALKVLTDFNIKVTYEQIVPHIMNRDKTGLCPYEASVLNINNKIVALEIILRKYKGMHSTGTLSNNGLRLNGDASIFIPDERDKDTAIKRITHLAIGAHPDDVEIMVQSGIEECYNSSDKFFGAVVLATGCRCPRGGSYANYTDDEIIAVRYEEQMQAASVGHYSALFMTNYKSETVIAKEMSVIKDIAEIIRASHPSIIYTHNLADSHPTHVSTAICVISALRLLTPEERPQKLYGCECWRNLDWLANSEKVIFPIFDNWALPRSLIGAHTSQCEGGKNYVGATIGRQTANATFLESNNIDFMKGANVGMDLTPLMDGGSISEFVTKYITSFANNVKELIGNC